MEDGRYALPRPKSQSSDKGRGMLNYIIANINWIFPIVFVAFILCYGLFCYIISHNKKFSIVTSSSFTIASLFAWFVVMPLLGLR